MSFATPYQDSASTAPSITTTSSTILRDRSGGLKRSQLVITNTSAATRITISKGDVVAVDGQGITLAAGASYYESTDGGYTCWQGAVQAVGNGNGTLAVVESFELR